jgi:hypothetical protein
MDKRITDAFRRETDGSWICTEATSVEHASGRIRFSVGARFLPEDTFMGVKIAKWLDSLVEARRAQRNSD